jgi:hypothetical protein
MTGKILRRCTLCKKFHASYLVEDPERGKYYLCYSCWKSRQSQDLEPTHPEEKKNRHEVQPIARDQR